MRSAIEEKWGVKLEVDHAVWPWLVEYAGWVLTRAEVGADGKRRTKGAGEKKQDYQEYNLAKVCCGSENVKGVRWVN